MDNRFVRKLFHSCFVHIIFSFIISFAILSLLLCRSSFLRFVIAVFAQKMALLLLVSLLHIGVLKLVV